MKLIQYNINERNDVTIRVRTLPPCNTLPSFAAYSIVSFIVYIFCLLLFYMLTYYNKGGNIKRAEPLEGWNLAKYIKYPHTYVRT